MVVERLREQGFHFTHTVGQGTFGRVNACVPSSYHHNLADVSFCPAWFCEQALDCKMQGLRRCVRRFVPVIWLGSLAVKHVWLS